MTIDDIIEALTALKTFDTTDPTTLGMSTKTKQEFLSMLKEVQFDSNNNNTYKIQAEQKSKYITLLKDKIDYLEGFIVRIARESKDI